VIRSAAILLVLVLYGCAATSVRHADRSATPALLQEEVRQNHERVQALTGNGRIAIETPEMAQSASFELTLRKPDSLLVKIEGPFGLDVGSAMVTRTEFSLYNSMRNQRLVGSTNPSNLDRILHVQLDFDDVLNLFTGGIFLSEDRSAPSSFAIEDEEFVLTYERYDGTHRYWIDPESRQIARIQHLDSSGKLTLEQIFSDFRTIGGVTIPQRIRITLVRERRRVSVSYSDLDVNPTHLQFTFDVPSSASRRNLQ